MNYNLTKSLFFNFILMQIACLCISHNIVSATELPNSDGESRIAYKTSPTSSEAASGSAGTVMPDLFTGTMSYKIPLDVVPGRKGMQPNLSLQYRSIRGDGWLGRGWDLEMDAIERKVKKDIDYNGDEYILVRGGSNVELVNIGANEYRAKIEGSFFRIKKLTVDNGIPEWDGRLYWEVTDKTGVKYYYGQTPDSRQDNINNPDQIFKWFIDKVIDSNGNYMTFSYYKDSGEIYIDQINYTGNGSLSPIHYVKFILDVADTRKDLSPDFSKNFEVVTRHRLDKIEVYGNGNRMWYYQFGYTESGGSNSSLLTSLKKYDKHGDTNLPVTTIEYYEEKTSGITEPNPEIPLPYYLGNGNMSRYRYGDFDGDGNEDLAYIEPDGRQMIALFKETEFASPVEWITLANGDPGGIFYNDFNGDGRTDVLQQVGWTFYVALSNGSGFDTPVFWLTQYGKSLYYNNGRIADFNGDGKMDLLFLDPDTYVDDGTECYALSDGTKFNLSGNCYPTSLASLNAKRFYDFNGDGKTDMLQVKNINLESSDEGFYISLSDGSKLVDPGNNPPWIVFGYQYHDKFKLADFNGDGKTDVLVIDALGNGQLALSDGVNFQLVNTTIELGFGDISRYATGYVNEDAKKDLIYIDTSGNLKVAYSNGDSFEPFNDWVYLGNGDPARYVFKDLNGDDKTDVFFIRENGEIELVDPLDNPEMYGAGSLERYRYGDFNGDGRGDMAYIEKDGRQMIMISDEVGYKAAEPWLTLSTGNPVNILYSDFNGDGRTDILLQVGWTFYVALSNGSGFDAPVLWLTQYGKSLYYNNGRIADFNGDGKMDLLFLDPDTYVDDGTECYALSDGTKFNLSGNCYPTSLASLNAKRFYDFNGDGKTDMLQVKNINLESSDEGFYISLSDGSKLVEPGNNPPWIIFSYQYHDRFKLADFNGDGKTDVLVIDTLGNGQIALSNGVGFQLIDTVLDLGYSDLSRYRFADINGDNKNDLIYIDTAGDLKFAYSRGTSFSPWINWERVGSGTAKRYVFRDIDGDGKADAQYIDLNGTLEVSSKRPEPDNFLKGIDNGLGGKTVIEYEPSSSYKNIGLPLPVITLRSVTAYDGVDVDGSTTFYSYSGGYFDMVEVDYRGFGYAKVEGAAGPNGERSIQETWFHQGDGTQASLDNPANSMGKTKGKPFRMLVSDANGNILTETTTSYFEDPDGAEPWFNPPKDIVNKLCDGDSSCITAKVSTL